MAPRRFDSAKLTVGWTLPESVDFEELNTGVLFPQDLLVMANYDGGPSLQLLLAVEDGQAIVSSLTISRSVPDCPPDCPPISATMVHELPLGRIIDEVIARTATGFLALYRAHQAALAGRPHQFLTPDEVAATREGARRGSRRGRPVSDEDLRDVAAIVRTNSYDPRVQVVTDLHVSKRTASRWIAEARSRGFVTEEDK
jgi:hypothetical protein